MTLNKHAPTNQRNLKSTLFWGLILLCTSLHCATAAETSATHRIRVIADKPVLVSVNPATPSQRGLTAAELARVSYTDDVLNNRTNLTLLGLNGQGFTGVLDHLVVRTEPIPKGTIIDYDGNDLSEPDGKLAHYECPKAIGVSGLEDVRPLGEAPKYDTLGTKFGVTQLKVTMTDPDLLASPGGFRKLARTQQASPYIYVKTDASGKMTFTMTRKYNIVGQSWENTSAVILFDCIVPTKHSLILREGVTPQKSPTHRAATTGTYLVNGTTWTYINQDFTPDPASTITVAPNSPLGLFKGTVFDTTQSPAQIVQDIKHGAGYLTAMTLDGTIPFAPTDLTTLADIFPRLPHLRTLHVSYLSCQAIAAQLGKMTGLKDLQMLGCGLKNEDLAQLPRLTNLVSLSLVKNYGITTDPLFQALRTLNLTSLDLTGCCRVTAEKMNELPYLSRLQHYGEPSYLISHSATLPSGGRMEGTHAAAAVPQDQFTVSFWYLAAPGAPSNHWFSLGSTTAAANVSGQGNYFDVFSRPATQSGGTHQFDINTPLLKTDTAHRPKTVTWTEPEEQKVPRPEHKWQRKRAHRGIGEIKYHKSHPRKHVTIKYYYKMVQVPKSRVEQEPYPVYSLEAWKNNIASTPFNQTGWQHVVIQGQTAGRYTVFLNGNKVAEVQNIYGPGLSTLGRMHFGSESASHLCNIQGVHGQILPPTTFARVNKARKWVPVLYEGPFGPNGFNLLFDDAANLGKNTSGGNRNFTPPPTMVQSPSTPTS